MIGIEIEISNLKIPVPKIYIHEKCMYNDKYVLTLFGLANLKRLGGQNGPLPNFAISSQMTMKLGKVILWVEIFTN